MELVSAGIIIGFIIMIGAIIRQIFGVVPKGLRILYVLIFAVFIAWALRPNGARNRQENSRLGDDNLYMVEMGDDSDDNRSEHNTEGLRNNNQDKKCKNKDNDKDADKDDKCDDGEGKSKHPGTTFVVEFN